jgi:hypothetical protein
MHPPPVPNRNGSTAAFTLSEEKLVTVRTHRVPLSGSIRSLEVRNPAGSTTVEADPAAEEIILEVRALDRIAEELIDRLDLIVTSSSVRLSVPGRRLLRSPSFAIAVTTPPDTAVTVSGASADATLRGRLGSAVLTSSSGDLTVEHCTELQARSASGDVRAGRVEGPRPATSGSPTPAGPSRPGPPPATSCWATWRPTRPCRAPPGTCGSSGRPAGPCA